jgi:hypothetical protein
MTVDRQRELVASQARLRQAEEAESTAVPVPGGPCRIPGCAADTRLGTLAGGGQMLCAGFGQPGPCIARWLMETDIGTYEEWLASEQTKDY